MQILKQRRSSTVVQQLLPLLGFLFSPDLWLYSFTFQINLICFVSRLFNIRDAELPFDSMIRLCGGQNFCPFHFYRTPLNATSVGFVTQFPFLRAFPSSSRDNAVVSESGAIRPASAKWKVYIEHVCVGTYHDVSLMPRRIISIRPAKCLPAAIVPSLIYQACRSPVF